MSTNMECSKLKIPVYRYFNDEQISGTQDFRYVCLQPGCPKMEGEMKMHLVTEKKEDSDKTIHHLYPACNWGGNTLNELLNHLQEKHQAPRFRHHIDYCCGQLFFSRIQAVLHFMNHALRFQDNTTPIVNIGSKDELCQHLCMRLDMERKIVMDTNYYSCTPAKRKLAQPDFKVFEVTKNSEK